MLSFSLCSNASASRFTSIATLFAQPFVLRPAGSTCRAALNATLRSSSQRHTSLPHACYAAATYTPCSRHSRMAPNPAASPTSAATPPHRALPPQSPSIRYHRALLSPQSTHTLLRFSLRLAPAYVHISSSAVVDAAIVAALPLARLALIARISSSATASLSEPTAHRRNARAHYTRRRRHADTLYTHLNRLPFDMLWEARLISVRWLLHLAIAALVHLLNARASVFRHPIGAEVSTTSICPLAHYNSHPKQRFGRHYIPYH